LAHEPDEQAFRGVVPRDTGDDSDLTLKDGRGFGIGGRGSEVHGRLILGRVILCGWHRGWR
jgi:hypothetical protein